MASADRLVVESCQRRDLGFKMFAQKLASGDAGGNHLTGGGQILYLLLPLGVISRNGNASGKDFRRSTIHTLVAPHAYSHSVPAKTELLFSLYFFSFGFDGNAGVRSTEYRESTT